MSDFAWALLLSAKKANKVSHADGRTAHLTCQVPDALEPLHTLLQGTSAPTPGRFNGVHAAFLEVSTGLPTLTLILRPVSSPATSRKPTQL